MDVQGLDGSGVNTPISMHKHRTCDFILDGATDPSGALEGLLADLPAPEKTQ